MHYATFPILAGTPDQLRAALAARGLAPRLILTGQHSIDPADHGLDRLERVKLCCPGQRNPMAHSDMVARALGELLEKSAA